MTTLILFILLSSINIYGYTDIIYKVKDSNMESMSSESIEGFKHRKDGFYRYLDTDKLYIAVVQTNTKGETIKATMQAGDKHIIFEVIDGYLTYNKKKINLKGTPFISFPEVQLDVHDLDNNATYEYYSIRTDTLVPYRMVLKKSITDDGITSITFSMKGIIESIVKFSYFFKPNQRIAFHKEGHILSGSWYYKSILEEI